MQLRKLENAGFKGGAGATLAADAISKRSSELGGPGENGVEMNPLHGKAEEDDIPPPRPKVEPPNADGPTIFMKLHYAFDNWMVKPSSFLILIVAITCFIVVVGGFFNWKTDAITVFNDAIPNTFLEGMWLTWKYLNDPSAHSDAVGNARIVGVITSLMGLFVFAMLLGFVGDLITVNMDELRKGKSKVCEHDHTLILGWTDKMFTIMKELCDANETRPDGTHGGVIVILDDKLDKETMNAELEDRIPEDERMGTKFVFRVGSPMLATDLQKVATNQARSIIVLGDDEAEPTKSDAGVLRVVIALGATLSSKNEAHITTELREMDAVPLLNLVGENRIETVVSQSIIGRLMVMSVRQPGLTKVYDSILGFEGDEFYIQEWPQCVGKPFKDLDAHFPDAIVMGVKTADGEVLIKPSMDRPMENGDEILVISEDDDTYDFVRSGNRGGSDSPGPIVSKSDRAPEQMLICGWRRDMSEMLTLLDKLMPPGSVVTIFCRLDKSEREERLEDAGLDAKADLTNISLEHEEGHARRHYEKLKLEEFSSCLIVADEDQQLDLMNSDSQCISSLILVRDVQMKRKEMGAQDPNSHSKIGKLCPTLVEILDPRTQESLRASAALQSIGDFVQSNEMVSRVLAMVSEERSVNTILDELLGGDGAGFELHPATKYLNDASEQITFLQLSKRLHDNDMVLVGYQMQPVVDAENTVINPRDKLVTKGWNGTSLIVITADAPRHPDLHYGSAGPGASESSPIGVLPTMG